MTISPLAAELIRPAPGNLSTESGVRHKAHGIAAELLDRVKQVRWQNLIAHHDRTSQNYMNGLRR
jgi:hypothetical protein